MIVRDPIHGDINIVDDLILELILTKEFQRLRRIKQLGLSQLVFPGAEHSRYTHSIGVYYLSTVFTNSIENNCEYVFSDVDKRCLNVAALLHDVGHGALSHTAEEMFDKSHEVFSAAIILSESTEINAVLNKYMPDHIEDINSIIEKKHHNKVLNELLSSTIDIDRLDYLVRDSHNTGVVYGNIDVSRLSNCVQVFENQVVYSEKALNTLEDVICSRYQMFNQVYTVEKSLGYDCLIKALYDRCVTLYNHGYEFECDMRKLIPFITDTVTIDSYLLLDDYSLLTIMNDFTYEEDTELRSYAKALTCALPFSDEANGKYKIIFDGYAKASYSESIKLLFGNEIKLLEDCSPIVKALKNEKIQVKNMEFFIDEK